MLIHYTHLEHIRIKSKVYVGPVVPVAKWVMVQGVKVPEILKKFFLRKGHFGMDYINEFVHKLLCKILETPQTTV